MSDTDEDKGAALRRSLGLKPRGKADEAPPREEMPSAVAVRRRSSTGHRSTEPPPPPVDPRTKPTGKLPPDAQIALRSFYVVRPAVDLPPYLHELPGTLGRYFGDGRPEREVLIGWRPGFVLYVLPAYDPEVPPTWEDGGLVDPGLHEQPEQTERGFKIGAKWNRVGEGYIFLAWQSDPAKPAPVASEQKAEAGPLPGESARDFERRQQREKRDRELAERKAARDARRRS